MSKILLVPTDFSKGAKYALAYATEFAQKEKAKIILLHVYEAHYPTSDLFVPVIIDEIPVIQNKVSEKLKALCLQITNDKKVKCEFICEEGLAQNVILQVAKKIRPACIIIGTKGITGIPKIAFGSTAAAIIEKADCPVIAIPEGGAYKVGKEILFLTNYHYSDLNALKKIIEIAKPLKSRITVLHCADSELTPETEQGIMKNFIHPLLKKIKYQKISYKIEYGDTPQKVLDKHIRKTNPSLIAMSTQNRNFFEKLFESSMTKKMLSRTKVPLLVFHHKKEAALYL